VRILTVGDVVGRPGRRAFQQLGRDLARAYQADFVIVNCENAAAGFGVTPEIAGELFEQGAHCLTSGNHIWRQKTVYGFIDEEPRLLRPANFPPGTPGQGIGVYPWARGEIAVMNLMGTALMEPLDCPFRIFDELIEDVQERTPLVVLDFHAECTSEKVAMGHYADGRASVVFGTHTHVQTADESILPGGTGYITDIGMTGPEDSVLGISKHLVLERFLSRLPVRFEVAENTPVLCGALFEVDENSGKTLSVKRVRERAVWSGT
jgi:metallophosphoesterase (TIGR00282 family)